MKQVIILRGLIASGKTTWAKEQLDKHPGVYKRINKDDLRRMLDNGRFSKHNEQMVLATRDFLIVRALDGNNSVIIDDTNFEPKHEERIREIVSAWNKQKELEGSRERAEVIVKFFDVPVDECVERDRFRPEPVGEDVIRDMYNRYLRKLDVLPNNKHDPTLPDAIICDIDGTLALPVHRNPYDVEKCNTDVLNEPIAEILARFDDPCNPNNIRFILVSGREEKFMSQTTDWLNANLIHFDALYMRKTGDFRQDGIVKKEIYEEHIKGKYNVCFVLDDRDRVVLTWRQLGLTCLQVAEGKF